MRRWLAFLLPICWFVFLVSCAFQVLYPMRLWP